jgi:hypothetical protein
VLPLQGFLFFKPPSFKGMKLVIDSRFTTIIPSAAVSSGKFKKKSIAHNNIAVSSIFHFLILLLAVIASAWQPEKKRKRD